MSGKPAAGRCGGVNGPLRAPVYQRSSTRSGTRCASAPATIRASNAHPLIRSRGNPVTCTCTDNGRFSSRRSRLSARRHCARQTEYSIPLTRHRPSTLSSNATRMRIGMNRQARVSVWLIALLSMWLAVRCGALSRAARVAAHTRFNSQVCCVRPPFDDACTDAFDSHQRHRQASHSGINRRNAGSTGHHCTIAMPNATLQIHTNAGICKGCATGSGVLAGNPSRAGENSVAHSGSER